MPADVRQPEIAALKPVSQLRMIDPKQMKKRRLHVEDFNPAAGRRESEFIGSPDDLARPNPAPGHKN